MSAAAADLAERTSRRMARDRKQAHPQVGDVVLYALPSSGAERPAMVLGTAADEGLMLSVFVTPGEGLAHGTHDGKLAYVPSARRGERGEDGTLPPGRWTHRGE